MAKGKETSRMRNRIETEGRRPVDQTLLGSESIRMLSSLLFSVGFILLVFNLPFKADPSLTNWQASQIADDFKLRLPPEVLEEMNDDSKGIVTSFEVPSLEDPLPLNPGPENDPGAPVEEEPRDRIAQISKIEQQPVLDFVDEGPSIVGGTGALYLNIEYPQIALELGIEGLSILEFIVEEDGSTTDVNVIKSLHPACDSAAVAAVSQTRFVPGRQNGDIVRVRMRLPIRFKMINPLRPIEEQIETEETTSG